MKAVIYVLAALLLLVGGVILTVTLTISTDQVKTLLVDQVQTRWGRELRIEGPVSWSFFPTLGMTIRQASLQNPAGWPATPAISVDEARIGVALRPLFSHQVQVDELLLTAPHIQIVQRDDGRTNLDVLFHPESSAAGTTTVTPASHSQSGQGSGSQTPYQISINGIHIEHALVSLLRADGKQDTLSDLSVQTGKISLDEPNHITVSTAYATEHSQGQLAMDAVLTYQADTHGWRLSEVDAGLDAKLPNDRQLNAKAKLELQAQPNETGWQINAPHWQLEAQLGGKDINGHLNTHGSLNARLAAGQLGLLNMPGWELNADLAGQVLPAALHKIQIKADLTYDLAAKQLAMQSLQAMIGKLNVTGELSARVQGKPSVQFMFHSPELDTAWLTASATEPLETTSATRGQPSISSANTVTAQPANKSDRPSLSTHEPDLGLLSLLDLEGHWQIADLKAPHTHIQGLTLAVNLADGMLSIPELSGKVYQGSFNLPLSLNSKASPASWRCQPKLSGIQIDALLKAWTDKAPVAGVANINGELSSRGLTVAQGLAELTGNVHMLIADGAVNGVNIAAMIRNAKATLQGKPKVDAPEKTDFSAMSANWVLKQGRASTSDLTLASPLLRLQGAGSSDLPTQTLDFKLDVAVAATTKGQGGEDLQDLTHLTIPFRIDGTWTNPGYHLDLDNLLKNEAKQQLQQKLKDKLKLPGKLPGKLGSLFG